MDENVDIRDEHALSLDSCRARACESVDLSTLAAFAASTAASAAVDGWMSYACVCQPGHPALNVLSDP